MAKKKTAVNPKGRPSEYNQQVADVICSRIMQGESLTKICKEDDMPALSTVCNWLASNNEKYAYFLEQYMRAREAQADILADEIIDLADEADQYTHSAQRLKVDARKWVASKLKPKKYGDKVDITTNGEKITPEYNFKNLTDEQLAALEALAASNGNTGGEVQA